MGTLHIMSIMKLENVCLQGKVYQEQSVHKIVKSMTDTNVHENYLSPFILDWLHLI